MPDGRAEVLGRLGEAVGQVLAVGLNDLKPDAQRAVAEAFESGARLRLVILTPGLEIHAQLVVPDRGEVTELFAIHG